MVVLINHLTYFTPGNSLKVPFLMMCTLFPPLEMPAQKMTSIRIVVYETIKFRGLIYTNLVKQ